MTDWPVVDGEFALGDLAVERGGAIHDARLVWQAHGTLNATRDNVIVYPCSYTANHDDLNWLIGPDGILDPHRWFIVIPDMFSGGLSSSAADTPDYPPLVTIRDNVLAQRRLLDEHFGIGRLAAVYGFSMGAIQAYHWAALFPDLVERAFVVCGSARTAVHNKVFLSGLLRTLEAAPEYLGAGRFSARADRDHPCVRAHLRRLGPEPGLLPSRAVAHRTGRTRPRLVHPDRLGGLFAEHRAANLYAQALSWYHADISAGGDLAAALGAISARVLLLPGETDLYFRVADNATELPHLAHGELRPIPSIWGHRAGSPFGIPADFAFLKTAVAEWLDQA